jgi:hypothetical protein
MEAESQTSQVAVGFSSGAVGQPGRDSLARPANVPKRGLEFGIWILSCLLTVLGVLKAAYGPQHLFWLMVWPVPMSMAGTIFFFVRQGFYFENGVLVLGRRRNGR